MMAIFGIWLICGAGFALALDFDLQGRFPDKHRGATRAVCAVGAVFGFPVLSVALVTWALIAVADR